MHEMTEITEIFPFMIPFFFIIRSDTEKHLKHKLIQFIFQ